MADLHINNNKGWQYKWENWEDNIIINNYSKDGYEQLLQLLPNRNKKAIQERACKLGVRYITYDKNYFEEINSKSKAYWLGFLYADGYVTTNNRWGLELCKKDINHMLNFLLDFNCNLTPKIRTRKEIESCSFQINNSKMYSDLMKDGVIKNKTELLNFPNDKILPTKYYSHFIRGFFDGDGCVTYNYHNRIRKDRNNKIYNSLAKEVNFVCKSENFINKLNSILVNYDINFNLNLNTRDNLYVLHTSKKDEIIKFYNLIYKDSNENNRLDRKYIKFQELLCHLQ